MTYLLPSPFLREGESLPSSRRQAWWLYSEPLWVVSKGKGYSQVAAETVCQGWWSVSSAPSSPPSPTPPFQPWLKLSALLDSEEGEARLVATLSRIESDAQPREGGFFPGSVDLRVLVS